MKSKGRPGGLTYDEPWGRRGRLGPGGVGLLVTVTVDRDHELLGLRPEARDAEKNLSPLPGPRLCGGERGGARSLGNVLGASGASDRGGKTLHFDTHSEHVRSRLAPNSAFAPRT